MSRFIALLTSLLLSLVLARAALAAGAVEMQVEHIIVQSIEEYNQAMEAGTPEDWVKYFTDRVRRDGLLSVQEGKAAFADYVNWEFKTFRAKCVVKRILVTGRSAAVVFLWDAVHKPSGTPVKLEMVAVYEMASSGRFDSVSYYYDTAKAAKYFGESPAGAN